MEQLSPQLEWEPVTAASANDVEDPAQPSGLLRFAWWLAGVILPPICFLIGFPNQPEQPTGAGECAAVLLSRVVSLPIYPLLLTCIVSLGCLISKPEKYKNSGWVRLGIFSGVVLSLEYWFVFQAAIMGLGVGSDIVVIAEQYLWQIIWSLISIIVPWYFGRLFVFVSARHDSRGPRYTLAAVFVYMVSIGALVGFPITIALCLFCSTSWAVAAYVTAAIWLIRQRKGTILQFTLWQLLAATTWLALNFAAWRTAVLLVLDRMK